MVCIKMRRVRLARQTMVNDVMFLQFREAISSCECRQPSSLAKALCRRKRSGICSRATPLVSCAVVSVLAVSLLRPPQSIPNGCELICENYSTHDFKHYQNGISPWCKRRQRWHSSNAKIQANKDHWQTSINKPRQCSNNGSKSTTMCKLPYPEKFLHLFAWWFRAVSWESSAFPRPSSIIALESEWNDYAT